VHVLGVCCAYAQKECTREPQCVCVCARARVCVVRGGAAAAGMCVCVWPRVYLFVLSKIRNPGKNSAIAGAAPPTPDRPRPRLILPCPATGCLHLQQPAPAAAPQASRKPKVNAGQPIQLGAYRMTYRLLFRCFRRAAVAELARYPGRAPRAAIRGPADCLFCRSLRCAAMRYCYYTDLGMHTASQ
jgi:hypothetical protein